MFQEVQNNPKTRITHYENAGFLFQGVQRGVFVFGIKRGTFKGIKRIPKMDTPLALTDASCKNAKPKDKFWAVCCISSPTFNPNSPTTASIAFFVL
jgi:hypothetical protein